MSEEAISKRKTLSLVMSLTASSSMGLGRSLLPPFILHKKNKESNAAKTEVT